MDRKFSVVKAVIHYSNKVQLPCYDIVHIDVIVAGSGFKNRGNTYIETHVVLQRCSTVVIIARPRRACEIYSASGCKWYFERRTIPVAASGVRRFVRYLFRVFCVELFCLLIFLKILLYIQH